LVPKGVVFSGKSKDIDAHDATKPSALRDMSMNREAAVRSAEDQRRDALSCRRKSSISRRMNLIMWAFRASMMSSCAS
jgi:hypothetical protein